MILHARRRMSDCLERAVDALGHEPVIEGRPRHRPGVSPEEARAAIAQIEAKETASAAQSATETHFCLSPKTEPENSLSLFYRFDTNLPFIFDYSGNGRNTIPVGATRINGPDGQALKFSGKGYLPLPCDYAMFGPEATEGTIEFMLRPDSPPVSTAANGAKRYVCLIYLMPKSAHNILPDGYDEIGLFIKDDKLILRLGGSNVLAGSSPMPFRQGQWHSVKIVWKPSDRRLYIDGEQIIRNTSPYKPPRLGDSKGALGAHPTRGDFPFTGAFDNCKIWSCAL